MDYPRPPKTARHRVNERVQSPAAAAFTKKTKKNADRWHFSCFKNQRPARIRPAALSKTLLATQPPLTHFSEFDRKESSWPNFLLQEPNSISISAISPKARVAAARTVHNCPDVQNNASFSVRSRQSWHAVSPALSTSLPKRRTPSAPATDRPIRMPMLADCPISEQCSAGSF